MSFKPFDKSIKKSCICCIYGRKSSFKDEIFCNKRGVTATNDCCRKFKYDPLKRIPYRHSIDQDFVADDFLL